MYDVGLAQTFSTHHAAAVSRCVKSPADALIRCHPIHKKAFISDIFFPLGFGSDPNLVCCDSLKRSCVAVLSCALFVTEPPFLCACAVVLFTYLLDLISLFVVFV